MHISTRFLPAADVCSAATWSQEPVLRAWIRRAQETITNENLCRPKQDRRLLVVKAALASRALYFAASLEEPTAANLYGCFEEFVIRSLRLNANHAPEAVR